MPYCVLLDDRVSAVFNRPQSFPTAFLADEDPRLAEFTKYPEGLAGAIKGECQRRIFVVVDEIAQINLAATAAAGLLGEELPIYQSGLSWIKAMRAACAALIASGDTTFADDRNWPDPPGDVIALAKAY
ncbi:MAG: hypothetical protein AAGF59_12410 [Pseudomonadota bacterium]